jgi:hypothetical protein
MQELKQKRLVFGFVFSFCENFVMQPSGSYNWCTSFLLYAEYWGVPCVKTVSNSQTPASAETSL